MAQTWGARAAQNQRDNNTGGWFSSRKKPGSASRLRKTCRKCRGEGRLSGVHRRGLCTNCGGEGTVPT